MRWTLVLLAACVNDDLLPQDASAPPNPCAVVADHVVTPVAMGGGGGGGGGGGVRTYIISMMYQALVRNVSPGDSVGFQIDVSPDMYAAREDALTTSVSLTGNAQGIAPTLMPVLSAVSGGSMGMTQGIATFTPPSAGQPAGFHWVADLGPLAYGDVQTCLGVVLELPVNPALPPTFDLVLNDMSWTSTVATPDHGANPLRSGPLLPPTPRVTIASCMANPRLVELFGATPGGDVVIASGTVGGQTRIPAGPCAGTVIPLANVTLRGRGTADGAGYFAVPANMSGAACRNATLIGVDLASCGVGVP